MALFAAVAGMTFALAKLHLAQPGAPKAAAGGKVVIGDAYRGETIFGQTCAGCHGVAGQGGGVGPRLAGDRITLALVKQRIDLGQGVMPPGVVKGSQEEDVLAYVANLISPP